LIHHEQGEQEMKETIPQSNPRFAITMGDPAGIGPEITLRALTSPALPQGCDIVVIGDSNVLRHWLNIVPSWTDVRVMKNIDDFQNGGINVLDVNQIPLKDFQVGKPQAVCGRASFAYVTTAIDLCMNKKIQGMITNPISKEALHMAGIDFPGHTEILAARTGAKDFSMMFAVEKVYVVHVTTHVSLRDALDLVTRERVLAHIRLLNRTLRRLGINSPRIAVGGLNPHAGENGLFGTEEIRQIAPAVSDAVHEGISASGPFAPDTVFMRAFRGDFDGVVSMLHDHGFVALKSRDFENGVNITVGLPIIRTSVGHGTAFDIAGKGIASEKSLIAAINVAMMLWKNNSVG
jgi:4-hydroxythreonine-4-phosphate dehydrogenase